MKIRCRIGWHNWGQWGEVATLNGQLERGDVTQDVVLLTQETTCKDCCLMKRHIKLVKGHE